MRARPLSRSGSVLELNRGGGKWRVVDILTDGDSLAVSFRGQFGKIINTSGFPAVIQKMKARLAKSSSSSSTVLVPVPKVP